MKPLCLRTSRRMHQCSDSLVRGRGAPRKSADRSNKAAAAEAAAAAGTAVDLDRVRELWKQMSDRELQLGTETFGGIAEALAMNGLWKMTTSMGELGW